MYDLESPLLDAGQVSILHDCLLTLEGVLPEHERVELAPLRPPQSELAAEGEGAGSVGGQGLNEIELSLAKFVSQLTSEESELPAKMASERVGVVDVMDDKVPYIASNPTP